MGYLNHLATIGCAFVLAGCASMGEDLTQREPMGEFLLGHNIVVAKGAEIGPLSREATPEEWQEIVSNAIDARLGGYDGTQYYHVAVKVEGYILAIPGVPVVAAPKSALIITATVWDDAAGGKINEEPKQFTVFESVRPETVFSSGLTLSKQQQMEDLAQNAARAVHNWMLENKAWFASTGVDGEAIANELDLVTVAPPPRPGDA